MFDTRENYHNNNISDNGSDSDHSKEIEVLLIAPAK